MPNLSALRAELSEYVEVLLGRRPAPIDNGVMTLMEYANSVYSRAMEINMHLLHGESSTPPAIPKGSHFYKFRTGELRTFIELAKGAQELGSRRLTAAQMALEMREEYQ